MKRSMYHKEHCSLYGELSFACAFRIVQWRKKKSVMLVMKQERRFWIFHRKHKVAELKHKDTSMREHCTDSSALK